MTTKRHSVLVVEDEGIVAKDLQQTLIELDYDAFAIASSSEEAIACVSERCPDIVLMDIRIKGHPDGIETAGILRERFGIPCIYLTAHADQATIARAKITEPQAYLLKPVNPSELRSAIEVSLYRHAMERRLRERERWFSATLRSVADAVISVDLAGKVNFMNPVAELLTGSNAADVVGQPVGEVLRLLDRNAQTLSETPLAIALREKRPVSVAQLSLLNAKTGVVREINDSAAPVVDAENTLGAVMVFRDVTEQKKIEKQLELFDRLASLGTMAAGVAHEIKNPLTLVVANQVILANEIKTLRAELGRGGATIPARIERSLQEMREALSDMESGADRITRIVASLGTFARPAPVQAGRVDVGGAVEWAVRATAHEFRHRAKVRTSISPGCFIDGDEARLGQVLVNLLVNAAHAIEPGNVADNEVSVSARNDERGRIVIEVKDCGAGIPSDVLPHIFEPFYTTKPVGRGTGLGLSICHGIVTSLGGQLTVESQVGRGSLFRVILPPAGAPAAPVAPEAATPAVQRRGRILVIDDEPLAHRMMRRVLDQHDVVCVNDGRQALEVLRRDRSFDLIFSDMMMPDMTGMDFYEKLLETSPAEAERVVFVSAGGVSPRTRDFLATVPNPRFEKPFDVDHLRGAVQDLLGSKRPGIRPGSA